MLIIYNKEFTNIKFLNYINIIDTKDKIIEITDKIEICILYLSTYDDINNVTINTNPEIAPYFNDIINTNLANNTLMYCVFDVLKNMKIQYIIPYINLRISENLTSFLEYNKIKEDSLILAQFTNFNSDFLANIPINNYNVFNAINTPGVANSRINIKSILLPIQTFSKFQTDLSNNSIENLPLKIYKPIAPKGYRSVGHIFCNIQTQLNNIITDANLVMVYVVFLNIVLKI